MVVGILLDWEILSKDSTTEWFPAPIKVLQRVQNSHGHILSTADGKRTSVYLASARISGRNHAHAICANEQM